MGKTNHPSSGYRRRKGAPGQPSARRGWPVGGRSLGLAGGTAGRHEAFQEKSRAEGTDRRSYARLLRSSLWALGLSASILAAYALFLALVESPLFVVKRVELEVSGRPNAEEIRSLSAVQVGTNLFSLDAKAVAQRVETHPWVRNATVVKRFPDRLLIKVRERRPAVVVRIQGDLYYMDEEGRVLQEILPGQQIDLPMITGLEENPHGLHLHGQGRLVHQALSLLRALLEAPTLGSVSEIRVDRSDGLSFVLEEFPSPVYMGWSGFSAKAARFEKILPLLVLQSKGIECVDLRFSDQIVVRETRRREPRIPRGDRAETRVGSDSPYHPT